MLRCGIRSKLLEWARFVLAPQGLTPAPHHLLLIEALEAVSGNRGKTPGLIAF